MNSALLPFAGMDSRQIRRRNLRELISDYGTIESLADAADTSSSYLSQINNDSRGMGSKLARKLERNLRLPNGWIDQIHESKPNIAPIPIELALFRRLTRKQRAAITLVLKSMVRD